MRVTEWRRRSVAVGLAAAAAAAAFVSARAQAPKPVPGPVGSHTENGLAGYAKILCSGVFVS